MKKEEIEERIRMWGEPLGKTEKRLFDYLNGEEGKVVEVEEIIEEIYGVKADESSRNAIRLMIYRINYKIRRSGVKIISKRGIGYSIDEKKEYKKRTRGKTKNHYKDIKRISEEQLREIIKNLRKGKEEG